MHLDVMATEGVGLAFDVTDDGVKSAEQRLMVQGLLQLKQLTM